MLETSMQYQNPSRLSNAGDAPLSNPMTLPLRLHGLYTLPDGGEAVVGAGAGGGPYFLYHPLVWKGAAWVVNMPVAYVVDGFGRIQNGKGLETGWRVDDLSDTGETLHRGAP
jgi:hypothetical protein